MDQPCGCRWSNRGGGEIRFPLEQAMSKADVARGHETFPSYSYVPGLWPHPHSDPQGHHFGPPFPSAQIDDLANDATFRLGKDLFNSGYYWEAHEAWEHLWHAAGRRGPAADLLKALIQLAVAGVKAREGRDDGVRGHAGRAAELFATLKEHRNGDLDVAALEARARAIALNPPQPPSEPRQTVEIVFDWTIDDCQR
jgi:uncharacterized protein